METYIYKATKISIYVFPEKGIALPQSQFPHSCVCERFIYSQDRSTYCRIGRPMVGIYKSLKDTWMRKLGLRPRISFSRNIFYQIFVIVSLQCILENRPKLDFSISQRSVFFVFSEQHIWYVAECTVPYRILYIVLDAFHLYLRVLSPQDNKGGPFFKV
jgi:hypothetical protein